MKKLWKAFAVCCAIAMLGSAFTACKSDDDDDDDDKPVTPPVVEEIVDQVDFKIVIPFTDTPVISDTATAKIYKGEELVDTINAKNETLYGIGSSNGAISNLKVDNQLIVVEDNNIVVVPHSDEKGLSKLLPSTTYKVVLEGVTGTAKDESYTFTTKASKVISGNVINVGSAETDDFYTIQGALNYLASSKAIGDWTINVAAGKYHEILYYCGAANVTICGPADFDYDNSESPAAYIYWRNSQTLNSQRSRQTFIWQGTGNLVLKNLYFENTTARAQETSSNVQAETLYFDSKADLIVYNSKFMSYQDTLLIGTSDSTTGYGGRAWFYKCQIGGDVDFIWGYASVALFEECDIICRADGIKNSAEIFASRTVPSKEVLGKGFVLLNSTIFIEDGCDAYYGRSSGGGDSQALVINSKVTNGTINSKLWNSAGDITIQDGVGDYICAFMSYNNLDKDGNVISTTGKLDKTYDMSKRIADREYNGRHAILNREIVTAKAAYQNRTSKAAWDISAYEAEFKASADVSAKNIYVEPTYSKNVVGGNTVQLTSNKTGATFESEDTEVATVDSNGLVTTVALKDKTVKITVTDPDGGRADYAYINVVPTYVKAGAITIDETETTVPMYQIATISASFDVEPNDTDIVWTTSNPDVLKFVDAGKKTLVETITTTDKKVQVVSITAGNAVVTATSGVTPDVTAAGTKEFTVNNTRYYNAIEGTVIQDANLFGILNFQSGKVGIWHDIYVHAIYGTKNGKIAASGNRIQSRYGTIYIPVTESCVIDMTVQCTAEEDESKWFVTDFKDAGEVAPKTYKDTETEWASDAERQFMAYHYVWEYDAANDAAQKVPGADVKALFDATPKDNNRTRVGAEPDAEATYFAIQIPGGDRYITSITIRPDNSIVHEPVAATLTIASFENAKVDLDTNGTKTTTQTTTATSTDGTEPVITYKSSNVKIATVDEASGAVTAVGIGEAVITATAKHATIESVVPKTAVYTVHVSNTAAPEATYSIDLANTEGVAGDYGIFATTTTGTSAGYHNEHGWRMAGGDTLSVKVAGPSVIKFGKCEYGSSLPTSETAEKTATTNGSSASSGNCNNETMDFVYKGENAATVTFTFTGQAYIHSVSVEPYVASSITINIADFDANSVELDLTGENKSVTKTTTATASNSSEVTIEYSSSATTVATVDKNTGTVTAVGIGKANIIATATLEGADTVTASYTIVVKQSEATPTETFDFRTTSIATSTGGVADNFDFGILTGTAYYKNTTYGLYHKPVVNIKVAGPSKIYVPTLDYGFNGTVKVVDGDTLSDNFTTTGAKNTASTLEAAIEAGTVKSVIYAGAEPAVIKFEGDSSSYLPLIWVVPYEAPSVSVSVDAFAESSKSIDLAAGDKSVTQTTTGSASDGSEVTVVYSSSKPDVATVDSSTGVVTGVSIGQTVITATVSKEGCEDAITTYTVLVKDTGTPTTGYKVDFNSGNIFTEYGKTLDFGLLKINPGTKNAYGLNNGHGAMFKDGNSVELKVPANATVKVAGCQYNNDTSITATVSAGSVTPDSAVDMKGTACTSTTDFTVTEACTITLAFTGSTTYVATIEVVVGE